MKGGRALGLSRSPFQGDVMSEKEFCKKWLYNKAHGALLIESEAQEQSLEGEWFDSPAGFPEESKSEEVQQEPASCSEGEAKPVEQEITYHEHMGQWKSKEEKKAEKPKAKSRKKAK
jgi:hypothetical protein